MSVAIEIDDSEISEMEPEPGKDTSIAAEPDQKYIDAEPAAEETC